MVRYIVVLTGAPPLKWPELWICPPSKPLSTFPYKKNRYIGNFMYQTWAWVRGTREGGRERGAGEGGRESILYGYSWNFNCTRPPPHGYS